MGIKQSYGRFHHTSAICHTSFCMYTRNRTASALFEVKLYSMPGLPVCPVVNPMGEPNTPLAFRRRDECHLKQQAGHGKITVGIGHSTINSISFVANYNICFMHIVPAEESDRTLTKL